MKPLKASVPLFLVLSVLTLTLTFLAVPVSSRVATGSYYLDTPLPIASYYVGQYSNSTYFAVNGSNWQNFIRSTNATLVINTCINAMNDGEELQLGVATYSLSGSILVWWNKSISIVGEGIPFSIGGISAGGGVKLSYSGAGFAIDTIGPETPPGATSDSITLRNLGIITGSAGSGINLYEFNSGTLEHISMTGTSPQAGTIGIKLNATANAEEWYCYKISITEFETGIMPNQQHMTWDSVEISNCDYGVRPLNNVGGWGEGGYSVWTDYHAINTEFIAFEFQDNFITLIAPHIEIITDGGGDAFKFSSGHTMSLIENPYFTSIAGDYIDIQVSGQVTVHSYDIDYLTQNQSVSEASNTDWIHHGLAGTPDFVYLTVNESDSAYSVQLKDSNTTHFQIYLYDIIAAGVEVVDKTIMWEAVYQP